MILDHGQVQSVKFLLKTLGHQLAGNKVTKNNMIANTSRTTKFK
jgi:hypothetical protein